MINQQLNKTIPHWKAFRWNNDLHCLSQNTLGSSFLSQARICCQGPAVLRKTQHRPQNGRQRISHVRSSLSVRTPLDFGLEVLSLPQWFMLPPSALQFHLLQEEEFCLKPHKIQTDVTVKSSHLLIGMRKGGRVILILHFQLTNLELGCHRNSKICSSLGRECAARTAPAVSKGLGSHSILRPMPHWCSRACLHQDTAEGSKTSIICCRRQEFVSHWIFFLVATWGKKTGL